MLGLLGTTPSRGNRCALATAGSLLLLAGCAGGSATQQDPAEPPLIGDDTGRWDDRQLAVIDTVEAYNDWYRDSLKTAVEPTLDMRTLRRIAAEPYATDYGREVSIAQEQGIEMRGEQVFEPLSVRVDGDRAVLRSCWDARDADLVVTYAKPEQQVKPAPPTLTVFTLERVAGDWKITDRKPRGRC